MSVGCRVIKVGGSLFGFRELPERLDGWLADQSPAHNVFVPGGGAFANAVRELDAIHELGGQRSHVLCIQLLEVTASFLAELLPNSHLIQRFDDLRSAVVAPTPGNWVLSVADFLRRHEPLLEGTPIPHDWRSSSDSIAARVAQALPNAELVLIKSCDPPPNMASLADAAVHGLVDRALPDVAEGIKVRWVNLT